MSASFDHPSGTDPADDRRPASAIRIVATDALEIVFAATMDAVPLVRRALDAWCARQNLASPDRFAVLYASGEALANAVEHGSNGTTGTARLTASIVDARVRLCVEDGGAWKPRVITDERGRGFPIMQALMDDVVVSTTRSGKSVRLERALGRKLSEPG